MKRLPAQTEHCYSVKQLAFMYHVHPLTIRRYIQSGKLKAFRIGSNIRIRESDLEKFNYFVSPKDDRSESREKKENKIFFIDDPLFQLLGKGASIP